MDITSLEELEALFDEMTYVDDGTPLGRGPGSFFLIKSYPSLRTLHIWR
jgi:hypothetical protein